MSRFLLSTAVLASLVASATGARADCTCGPAMTSVPAYRSVRLEDGHKPVVGHNYYRYGHPCYGDSLASQPYGH